MTYSENRDMKFGTTAERTAYVNADVGDLWYDTTLNAIYMWDGSAWDIVRNNVNANLQVGDADVASTNPVPSSTGGASVAATCTRPDNTTAYGAGDVVGTDPATNMTFASVAPVSGGHFLLTNVDLRIDAAAIPSGMTTFDLHLFNAAPTAIADNTAWALADADRAKYLGKVTLSAPSDVGGTLWSQTDGINKKFKCAAASTTIYGQLVTTAAYTPTALVVKTITLHTVGV